MSRWDNIPPLRYNMDDIEKAVSFQECFEKYTGLQFREKKNVRCISPEHSDKKPSMTIYHNNCYCNSCHASFDRIGLVALDRGLDASDRSNFPKLCEALCEDFGIDPHTVSNLSEREAAIEREFGDGVKNRDNYTEYFPLTTSELDMIGLHNSNGTQEMFFPVSAEDYYINAYFDKADMKEYGKSAMELTSEERAEYISNLPKRVKDSIYTSEGKPAQIQASYREAIEIGRNVNPDYLLIQSQVMSIGCNVDDKGHAYLPAHTLSDIWDYDKRGTEKMIMDKIGDATDYLGQKINALNSSRSAYEGSHDLEREEKLMSLYKETSGNGALYWTEAQKKRLQEFIDYKHDAIEIQCCKDALKDIEKIYDKMNGFLIRRAEHEAEFGDVPNENKPSPNLPE